MNPNCVVHYKVTAMGDYKPDFHFYTNKLFANISLIMCQNYLLHVSSGNDRVENIEAVSLEYMYIPEGRVCLWMVSCMIVVLFSSSFVVCG